VHHGAGLRTLTGDAGLAAALARDHRSARLTVADRAMLDYAVKLTRAPAEISAADVEGLRAAGLSDAAILDVCQIVAYYNYVNRLADGLGVELEPFWSEDDLVLPRAEFEALAARRRAARAVVDGGPRAPAG